MWDSLFEQRCFAGAGRADEVDGGHVLRRESLANAGRELVVRLQNIPQNLNVHNEPTVGLALPMPRGWTN